MSSYVLGVLNKKDLEKYGLYAAAGFQSIAGYEVEVVAVEQPKVLEGSFPGTSVVLMKFKNTDDAEKWYRSSAYQAAIPLRQAAADTPFLITFPGND